MGERVLAPMLALDRRFSPAYPAFQVGDDWWLRSGPDGQTYTAVVWEITNELDVTEAGRMLAAATPRSAADTSNVSLIDVAGRPLAVARSTTTAASLPGFLTALRHVRSPSWFVFQTHRGTLGFAEKPPRILAGGGDKPLGVILPQGAVSLFFDRAEDPDHFDQLYGGHPRGTDGLRFRESHSDVSRARLPDAYVSQFLLQHGISAGMARLTDSRWTAFGHNSVILCKFPGVRGLSSVHLRHERNALMNQAVAVDGDGSIVVFTQQAAGDDARSIWLTAWGGARFAEEATSVGTGLCIGDGKLLQLDGPAPQGRWRVTQLRTLGTGAKGPLTL